MGKKSAYKRIKNMEGDPDTIKNVLCILREEIPELCEENIHEYLFTYTYHRGADWQEIVVKDVNVLKAREKFNRKTLKRNQTDANITSIKVLK